MVACASAKAAAEISLTRDVMFCHVIPYLLSTGCGITKVVGVGVVVGVEVGFGVGIGVVPEVFCFGADQTRQTFFLPSFLQTNLLVGVSKNAPALLQILPILGAAATATVAVAAIDPNIRAARESWTVNLRMTKALPDR